MKILITGGSGYIAKSLYNAYKDRYDITSITRKDLDLVDPEATIQWFSDKHYDVLIHCAVEGGSRLKSDTFADMDKNLRMYYNLLQCQTHYSKFIQFGSGAELLQKGTPYGLSKHVIQQSMLEKSGFYNIRIYGVFDENELDTRFIKSSIKRYINHKDLIIHQNKYMDFFFTKDLVSLVEFCILNNNAPKDIDCTYSTSRTLHHIADMINKLDKHSVNIVVEEPGMGKEYIGKFTDLGINYTGLEEGIINVYNKLI